MWVLIDLGYFSFYRYHATKKWWGFKQEFDQKSPWINESEFRTAFHKMGRGEQFSYDGLTALYDYLEQLEYDTDTEIELDVIALCCEYAEYDSLAEFQKDYGEDYQTIEDIEERTTVILKHSEHGFIIQQF